MKTNPNTCFTCFYKVCDKRSQFAVCVHVVIVVSVTTNTHVLCKCFLKTRNFAKLFFGCSYAPGRVLEPACFGVVPAPGIFYPELAPPWLLVKENIILKFF